MFSLSFPSIFLNSSVVNPEKFGGGIGGGIPNGGGENGNGGIAIGGGINVAGLGIMAGACPGLLVSSCDGPLVGVFDVAPMVDVEGCVLGGNGGIPPILALFII